MKNSDCYRIFEKREKSTVDKISKNYSFNFEFWFLINETMGRQWFILLTIKFIDYSEIGSNSCRVSGLQTANWNFQRSKKKK